MESKLVVGQGVYLRGKVLEVVEPNNRGIGVEITVCKNKRFTFPIWCDESELTEAGSINLTKIGERDMIAWLTDLNSNWAVCRNTRSFLEGQPSEYWKKFDKAMGEAFELQIALMKLMAQPATAKEGAK